MVEFEDGFVQLRRNIMANHWKLLKQRNSDLNSNLIPVNYR